VYDTVSVRDTPPSKDVLASSKGTSCEIIHSSYLISIMGTFHDPRGYLQHNHLFMLLLIYLIGNSAYIIATDERLSLERPSSLYWTHFTVRVAKN